MSFSRGQILKTTILKEGYFRIIKKLDDFWKFVCDECLAANNLKGINKRIRIPPNLILNGN